MTAIDWLRKDFRGGMLGQDFAVWCIEHKIIQSQIDSIGPLHSFHGAAHPIYSRSLCKLGKKIRFLWRRRIRKQCRKLGYEFPDYGIMLDWVQENLEINLY